MLWVQEIIEMQLVMEREKKYSQVNVENEKVIWPFRIIEEFMDHLGSKT